MEVALIINIIFTHLSFLHAQDAISITNSPITLTSIQTSSTLTIQSQLHTSSQQPSSTNSVISIFSNTTVNRSLGSQCDISLQCIPPLTCYSKICQLTWIQSPFGVFPNIFGKDWNIDKFSYGRDNQNTLIDPITKIGTVLQI